MLDVDSVKDTLSGDKKFVRIRNCKDSSVLQL